MKNNALTLDSIVSRNKDVLSGNIDEEIVLMSFTNNAYYGMNHVASRIWQLIEEPTPVKVIIQALLREYDVDIQVCRDEVTEYLNILHQRKLLLIH